MRPDILNPLFASVGNLEGVGEKTAKHLSKLLGFSEPFEARIIDLLFHLPRTIINRSYQPKISEARENLIATIKVEVVEHIQPQNNRLPYKIKVKDDTGEMFISFFKGGDWLKKQLPAGQVRFVSGKLESYKGTKTFVHPDYILEDLSALPLIEPVYSLAAGVSQKLILKSVREALARLAKINLNEWHEKNLFARQKFISFVETLQRLHNPQNVEDILPTSIYTRRLAFDELLSNQLAFALVRAKMKRAGGRSWQGTGRLGRAVQENLTFELTDAQKTSIKEICTDLSAKQRMMRLLQGDVGSGKTIVALFAACQVIESGGQVALMAPTEILARQHFATITNFTKNVEINVAILTGKDKASSKRDVLAKLESGEINLIIGTHSLFQQGVVFKNLGLAVVDEQHRFGVQQRLALASKGEADILLATATPIPRTLVLSHYGNMDISKLDELPKGRGKILTNAIPKAKIENLMKRIKQVVAEGNQVYWVCPLVEESEKLDLTSATARFGALQKIMPGQVALLHGKMKSGEKEKIMQSFKSGEIKLLVATTVIEVGVDVRDVKIMVIEHAERFGLSQLHQLRGRIGRGQSESESFCMLLYQSPLGEVATERLKIMRESVDGFVLAEKDLQLRGAGDLLGTKQSGEQEYEISDLSMHADLLNMACQDAKLIINQDEDLQTERGEALRMLLYLFARDDAVRLLRAG